MTPASTPASIASTISGRASTTSATSTPLTPASTSGDAVPPTPDSNPGDAVPPTPTAEEATPPPTASPPTPITETPPRNQDYDRIPHEDHSGAVREKAKNYRISLRTRRPRLWRHKHEIYESMCCYEGMCRYLLFITAICVDFLVDMCFAIDLYVGIDNGEYLAAPGIIWHVYGRSWEVLLTGSLNWKLSDQGNKRSHKLVLGGPHFVFVRRADKIGTNIGWEDIFKFHATQFFQYGTPASAVTKTIMAQESARAKAFLADVKNARIWSDIRIIQNPAVRRKRKFLEAEPENSAPTGAPKRSARLLQREKKSLKEATARMNAEAAAKAAAKKRAALEEDRIRKEAQVMSR